MELAWWLSAKDAAVAWTGLERDALHIYAGIAIMFVTAPWLAKGLRDRWVVVPLLVATLANEALDIVYERWPEHARWAQYAASIHDLLNTLAVPLLIMIVVRRAHACGLPSAKPVGSDPGVSVDQLLDDIPPR